MPKLRQPPAKPELAEIEDHAPPVTDIEIELSGDDLGDAEVDLSPSPNLEVRPEPQPDPVSPADENPLQKALDAQRRAEELQRATQRERDDALRQARERDEELSRERGEREDAQYNSVLTAIAAEQSALDKAEADYAAFAAAGDWGAASKAQRAMVAATSRLDRLDEGKQAFETKRESSRTENPEPLQPSAQPAAQDFEQKIAALPDTAKTWLRKHPEFMNDQTLNKKISAAHNYFVDVEGVEAFSTAYFDALDDRFGFKAAVQPSSQPTQPQPQPQKQRSIPMSAPVSRDVPTPSGTRQPSSKMTLTAEERDIARKSFSASDMTNEQKEFLYAKNKQKLQKMRASGEYPNSERN